ncbi:MAG TPA: hypothetical protein VKZ50_04970 [bacterium]|nr:hypothetical protein [bacterium]
MDVSVRPRPHAARSSPVLRVVETSRLFLHEEVESGRVARLSDALRRDGVLRNPPVVAPMPNGRAAVLDGANRVTALEALGIPHAVVHVVDYTRPEIVLSTWRHYVRDRGRLGRRVAELGEARILPVDAVASGEADLASGAAAALVVDRGGIALLGDRGGVAAALLLSRLVALYRGRDEIYRVERGDLETLHAEYGPGTLVVFPSFSKDDIVRLAAGAGRLPTGITRHLIPGRVLRLNTPLDWLGAPADEARKQAELDATVQRRWLAHGVRYYAEPTFLFDE